MASDFVAYVADQTPAPMEVSFKGLPVVGKASKLDNDHDIDRAVSPALATRFIITTPSQDEDENQCGDQRATAPDTQVDNDTTTSTTRAPSLQTNGVRPQRVLPLRIAPPPSPRRVEVLQQWVGTVIEVKGESIWATISDLTDTARPDEVVELSIKEISPLDVPLLEQGAVFYWTIGYETRPGSYRRTSSIRFRRLPRWKMSDIDKVNRIAACYGERFNRLAGKS